MPKVWVVLVLKRNIYMCVCCYLYVIYGIDMFLCKECLYVMAAIIVIYSECYIRERQKTDSVFFFFLTLTRGYFKERGMERHSNQLNHLAWVNTLVFFYCVNWVLPPKIWNPHTLLSLVTLLITTILLFPTFKDSWIRHVNIFRNWRFWTTGWFSA